MFKCSVLYEKNDLVMALQIMPYKHMQVANIYILGRDEVFMHVTNYSDLPSTRKALFDTLAKKIAEERQRVVQLHLLVIKSQGESQRPKQVPAQTKTHNTPHRQTQAYAVISDK